MESKKNTWYKVYTPKSDIFHEIYADRVKIKPWSKHLVFYHRKKIVAYFTDWEFFCDRKQ